MISSTRALFALSAVLVLAPPAEDLVYAPDEELTLVRTFDSEALYELEELTIEVDGEEFPHGEAPELTIDSDEHVVVTDELVAVEGGRPLALRRTFDELSRSVTYGSPEEDEDFEELSICDLEGSSVLFTWDEDEELYEATDEDEVVDESVLADLIEDMDLRQLLPDDEVEPGDEWDVDVDAYARLMWPGGFLHFYPEDGEFEENDLDGEREMVDNLEGDGTVTFAEVRDEDGISVAVLNVSFEVSSSSTTDSEGPDGSEAERTLEMSREIEGTVLWDIENGHLYSVEMEADAELNVIEGGQFETPDGEEMEFSQTRGFSGTISYSMTIEREG